MTGRTFTIDEGDTLSIIAGALGLLAGGAALLRSRG